MKANKFFLGLALIGAILTGCEKEPEQTGKYDTASYMSVSIAQVGGTRATPGTFVDGTDAENKIESIDFYFYENGGAPFLFTSAQNGAGGEFGGANDRASNVYHYGVPGSITNNDAENNQNNNIDEVVNAILVIQHNTGNIPAYMIAVINPNKTYSGNLDAVKGAIIKDYKNSANNHIMVNSVYKGADGSEVMATPITIDNLAINEENAKAKPVTIYVERTAARVQFSKKEGVNEFIDVKTASGSNDNYVVKYADGTEVTVKAKILGWDIVTTAQETSLAKKIDTNWADNINGMAWNQPALYRSYWADATLAAGKLNKQFSWKGLANTIGVVDYCLENTTKPEVNTSKPLVLADGTEQEDLDVSRTNVTKVVVKAQLTDGTNPITIVNWFGSNYKTEAELKVAVAQSLKNELVAYDGASYNPITASQIKVVENIGTGITDEQHSYEVYFDLADGVNCTWKKLNADNTYSDVTDPSSVLRAVQKAKIWNNGMAYYIVNIRHFGTGEKTGSGLSAEYQEAYYGVVRNHAYDIKFNGVVGLGTPVYNAATTIPEPVTPDFTESYVAAEINVLAWHLVSHEVTLQ